MNNPWTELPKFAPFELLMDSEWISEYRRSLNKWVDRQGGSQANKLLHDYSLRTDITPFPYYGDPAQAKVIVLQANPGYDPEWETNSLTPLILDLDRKNLLHQNELPLCYTQPKYAYWKYNDGRGNEDWYWKRTREVREKVGWEAVAKGVTYMEAFPYRSIKLMIPKILPPSQQYTFYLLREALKRNVWVVMTRMDRYWRENVPQLNEHHRIIKIKNRRSVYLSPGNMDQDAFEFLCEALK